MTSLCSLLAAGFVERVASPALARCQDQALLTGHLRGLGDAARACLLGRLDELDVLYFPQVTLLCGELAVRVDALVGLFSRARPLWCVVEIDGPSHQSTRLWDAQRDGRMQVPVLRIPASEVTLRGFSVWLFEELRNLAHGRVAS